MSGVDPFLAIAELAERELELAADGRLEDLSALAPVWDELASALPPRPPADARGPLERAAELQDRARAALMGRRDEMLREMRATARASRAADGYARIARRLTSRVDRSA
ncbi:MAG TPA: hypothetical protein VKG38_12035 [Solirubrobacteraceae bacterium]|nr:hypothetical protein [Solirubrobacteraceae bacterium]